MSGEDNEIVMKIEEAILYALAERNGGLRTEQIADIINRRKLHLHKDGQPVTSAQVYAVVMHQPPAHSEMIYLAKLRDIVGKASRNSGKYLWKR